MANGSRNTERRRIRELRSALAPEKQKTYSISVSEKIIRSKEFRRSKNIAIYWPFDGEIDPTHIIYMANKHSKNFYVPIIHKLNNRPMAFGKIAPGTKYKNNKYGIPEPIVSSRDTLEAHRLDLVLTPLVAFDNQGNRLGMGSGYYDKTFAFLNRRNNWHTPKLFGVAYEFQHLDKILPKPWDIPLSGVFTENGVYYFAYR